MRFGETHEFIGRYIEEPTLKFSDIRPSIERIPMRGLIKYGPYDWHTRRISTEITPIVICPRDQENIANDFIDGITNGRGKFQGVESLFKITFVNPLIDTIDDDISSMNFEEQGQIYERFLKNRIGTYSSEIGINRSMVYVFHPKTDKRNYNTPYYRAKALLTSFGFPSQMITFELLQNKRQMEWSWANIAVQTYAKLGGKPWVLNVTSRKDPEIIIGMGKTEIWPPGQRYGPKKRIIGYTTLFKHDGNYLFYDGTPVVSYEKYLEQLIELTTNVIKKYSDAYSSPKRIIFHFYKPPNDDEKEIVRNVIEEQSDQNIEHAIVHLNRSTPYRFFDGTDFTYLPKTGLSVRLRGKASLLLTSGRIEGARRHGVPQLIEVELADTNILDLDFEREIVNFVYYLTRVDWRGLVPQRAEPVTIKYSWLIADLISSLRNLDTWDEIMAQEHMKNKAWFL